MEDVKFKCLNCGNVETRNLLPARTTILGSLPIVNKEAACCDDPRYEDLNGHHRKMMQRSSRDYIPKLRA